MGPGPGNAHPRVLAAQSLPLLGTLQILDVLLIQSQLMWQRQQILYELSRGGCE